MLSDRSVNLFIIGLVLSAFVLFLFVYPTVGKGSRTNDLLKEIQVNVQQDNWIKAKENYLELSKTWRNKTSFWISFNYAEEDFATFDEVLTRMKSSIEYEDKQKAIEETDVLIRHMDNFDKLVPQP